jgi:hypothetical protein
MSIPNPERVLTFCTRFPPVFKDCVILYSSTRSFAWTNHIRLGVPLGVASSPNHIIDCRTFAEDHRALRKAHVAVDGGHQASRQLDDVACISHQRDPFIGGHLVTFGMHNKATVAFCPKPCRSMSGPKPGQTAAPF